MDWEKVSAAFSGFRKKINFFLARKKKRCIFAPAKTASETFFYTDFHFKIFLKFYLEVKEKALYICSRFQRDWRRSSRENIEKKSRVGSKEKRFESFDFGKNILSKIGEVH